MLPSETQSVGHVFGASTVTSQKEKHLVSKASTWLPSIDTLLWSSAQNSKGTILTLNLNTDVFYNKLAFETTPDV